MPIQFDVSEYQNPVFFETGTYKGDATGQALNAGFERVITVDIQPQFSKRATERFGDAVEDGRLTVITDHSVNALERVLPEIDRPITFWLDAHADGSGNLAVGEPDDDEMKCPVYEELKCISKHRSGQDTLLIDDIRLISDGGWEREDLNMDTLKELIAGISSEYSISYRDGWVEKDVLVARP